eukprot:253284-Lingulodinium_polyedra.AAC.1
MPPELQDEVQRRALGALNKKRVIIGRRMVRVIVEWFQSDSTTMQCYALADLLGLSYVGDDKA